MLRQVDQRAIPVLGRWSEGRDAIWHKWVNAALKILKKPALGGTFWPRQEMARKAFTILRERGAPAVPRLLRRLSDPDPDVRRISVQMLGAIGPSIGPQAFQQMTNRLIDTNQDVRNDVVWTIQFHRPEEYPDEILASIYLRELQDAYALARQNAMIGLMRMGKKAAPYRPMIENALSDPAVTSIAQELLNTLDKE
jgi:HEAT repeat protein